MDSSPALFADFNIADAVNLAITPTINLDSSHTSTGFDMRHFAATGENAMASADPPAKHGWLPKWLVVTV